YKANFIPTTFNYKLFSYRKYNKAGRDKNGIILRTRRRKSFNLKIKLDSYRTNFTYIGLTIGLFYSVSLKKYISIVGYSCGSISTIKHIESLLIGDYIFNRDMGYLGREFSLGTRLFLFFVKIRQIFCEIQKPSNNKISETKA